MREGTKIVYRHHCGWDVHASTQWKAMGHMSLPSQQISMKRQREKNS